MIVVNSCFIAWVKFLGGVATIHYLLSFLFIFTIIYIFYKITT